PNRRLRRVRPNTTAATVRHSQLLPNTPRYSAWRRTSTDGRTRLGSSAIWLDALDLDDRRLALAGPLAEQEEDQQQEQSGGGAGGDERVALLVDLALKTVLERLEL